MMFKFKKSSLQKLSFLYLSVLALATFNDSEGMKSKKYDLLTGSWSQKKYDPINGYSSSNDTDTSKRNVQKIVTPHKKDTLNNLKQEIRQEIKHENIKTSEVMMEQKQSKQIDEPKQIKKIVDPMSSLQENCNKEKIFGKDYIEVSSSNLLNTKYEPFLWIHEVLHGPFNQTGKNAINKTDMSFFIKHFHFIFLLCLVKESYVDVKIQFFQSRMHPNILSDVNFITHTVGQNTSKLSDHSLTSNITLRQAFPGLSDIDFMPIDLFCMKFETFKTKLYYTYDQKNNKTSRFDVNMNVSFGMQIPSFNNTSNKDHILIMSIPKRSSLILPSDSILRDVHKISHQKVTDEVHNILVDTSNQSFNMQNYKLFIKKEWADEILNTNSKKY